MLTRQRLLRSRPELNSGTAHIFWYMMDENMYFWCHPGIMCSHGSHESFHESLYHFRILDLKFDRKRQLQLDEALRGIQPMEDPTVEPQPSEKHCKTAVLNLVVPQLISRDIPFLQCQADQQSVLLDSDFE